MKWLKVFGLFAVLHLLFWFGAHWYKTNNPNTVLLVADTSFALKPHFVDMQRWIEDYSSSQRYTNIVVGTDKALIGDLDELLSKDTIFRVSFGRSTADSLKRYSHLAASEKIFLSDGTVKPSGWDVVTFQ